MEFSGKKIAVLGMGVNNRHLADYFTSQKIEFTAFDNWNDPQELAEKITGFDVLFRTPGLPYMSPLIQGAIKEGKIVYSQTRLFFDLCPCPIIGITGTKGKGTTSSLIHSILSKAGKKVWLAGNIGADPFEFLSEIQPEDFVVLELSSFQLQDAEKSPHIAVVLNITKDHVNPVLKMGTHYSQEEYVDAKSSIIKFQTPDDFAILNPHLPKSFHKMGNGKKIVYDPKDAKGYKTKLMGQHNLENIAPAIEVGKILSIPDKTIREAIEDFEPLPHRLNYFTGDDGITYVDDSFSTNEDSTIAAIDSFDRPLILILGGSDKGHDYNLLAEKILTTANVKGAVVIGDVAKRIEARLKNYNGQILTGAKNMHEIIAQARTIAKTGDVVLLSPAAASFGMFKDYKDRGSQFLKEARQ